MIYDYLRYDSMLHEGFHALTSRLIDKSLNLGKLISRLGGEVADYIPPPLTLTRMPSRALRRKTYATR